MICTTGPPGLYTSCFCDSGNKNPIQRLEPNPQQTNKSESDHKQTKNNNDALILRDQKNTKTELIFWQEITFFHLCVLGRRQLTKWCFMNFEVVVKIVHNCEHHGSRNPEMVKYKHMPFIFKIWGDLKGTVWGFWNQDIHFPSFIFFWMM